MEVGRPAQKSQPSRKGKKAWRKNIDIDEVTTGLEEARQVEKEYGVKDIASVPQDLLFTVDTTGDESKRQKYNIKPLKADEILARRSNVAPLVAPHKRSDKPKTKAKLVEGVSKKELHRLMQVAGRADGNKSGGQKADEEGFDLWDVPAEPKMTYQEPKKQKRSEEAADKGSKHDNGSFIADVMPGGSHLAPLKAPHTMSEAPISFLGAGIASAVQIPDAGKSYNPDHEEWVALLRQEHDREQIRENKRLELLRQKERIEELIARQDRGEVIEDDDEDDENGSSGDESEAEDHSTSTKLSVNPPVKVKKKLKSQRNKQQSEKNAVSYRAQLKELKQQVRDLEALPRLIKAELLRLEEQQDTEDAGETKETKLRTRKLGKHAIREPRLEVKLSDELTDTLRRLKPEGNLLHDRFRGLQQRGLIEARIPVAKKRKYTPKVTEKWSFKDFK